MTIPIVVNAHYIENTTKYRNSEISKRLSTTGWFALKIVRYETRVEGKNQITVEFYELLSDFKPRQINCWVAATISPIFTNQQLELFQNNNSNNLDLSLNNIMICSTIFSHYAGIAIAIYLFFP